MPQFQYKGRSGNGQLVDGEIEGSNSSAVAGMLMERDVRPGLTILMATMLRPWWAWRITAVAASWTLIIVEVTRGAAMQTTATEDTVAAMVALA